MDEPDGERKRRGSASQVEAVYSLPPSLPPQPRPGPSRPLAALPPISHHRAPPSLAPLDGFDKGLSTVAHRQLGPVAPPQPFHRKAPLGPGGSGHLPGPSAAAEAAKAKKKAEKKHGEEGQAKYAQKLAKIVRKQSYIEEEIERRKEQEDRKQQKRDEKEAKRNSVPVGV